MKIGITGNTGFIGTHLTEFLKTKTDIEIVPFEKVFFLYQEKMDGFVKSCDVIIHLAGRSKPHNKESVYIDNMNLTVKLYSTIQDMKFRGHLIFVSSIHESEDNYYAKSKKGSRETLSLVKNKGAKFTGLILPNVFGPGARVENSFITVWCEQLHKGLEPKIFKDVKIKLISINDLMYIFHDTIKIMQPIDYYEVRHTSEFLLSEILELLKEYKQGFKYNVYNKNDQFQTDLYETWKKDLATWQ